jgi:hypothetical protein
MPRGIPKKGFRMTKNRRMGKLPTPKALMAPVMEPVIEETEEQIRTKLNERFAALAIMTDMAIAGEVRAVVVSGPAGLGKSFSVMKSLDDQKAFYATISGFVRPTGLYKTLYEYRHKNCVVVFDDADSIFRDEISLNLLKKACDTTKKRTVMVG